MAMCPKNDKSKCIGNIIVLSLLHMKGGVSTLHFCFLNF